MGDVIWFVLLFIVGVLVGFAWDRLIGPAARRRRRPAQAWFVPRLSSVDKLARRDARKPEDLMALASSSPRQRKAKIRKLYYTRIEGTDIGRRTGALREPEDPVR